MRDLERLWKEADEIWDRFHAEGAFSGFVASDYVEVYKALQQLQGRVSTVLEWGSGLGVITIMASRLGFEACGIEIEPELVEHARSLAEKHGPGAQFSTGSFVPEEYEWSPEIGDENFRTDLDGLPAYDELDMELRDFDLVYAYPWPDEQTLYRDIMKQCGGEHALLMSYDCREGLALTRCGDWR